LLKRLIKQLNSSSKIGMGKKMTNDIDHVTETDDMDTQALTPEQMTPEMAALTDDLIGAIKSVYDPEIPVDVYELGLIYRVDVSDDRDVTIDMTLTAPGCPVAEHMPRWVEDAVRSVEGVCDVQVNMVFDPPWDPSRMSDEARVALNMF
jgi:FeS assembly SUF system protein